MDEIKILMNIRKECNCCQGCPYSGRDEYDDLYCRIQRITGTYPDSWKEVSDNV